MAVEPFLVTLKPTFDDLNGAPLAGGKLYTYVAGTSTPLATFVDKDGITPNTNPIILDANGTSSLWLGSGTYKFVLTDADDVLQYTVDGVKSIAQIVVDNINLLAGGTPITGNLVPDGGLTGDVLTKNSGANGDAIWKGYGYSGFSARFGQTFSSTNLDDTLKKILNIQYAPPDISFTAFGAGTIREKGTPVTSSTLTANVTKKSDAIVAIRYYIGSTLLFTNSSPNAAGGTDSYNWTGSFSDNVTFKAQADDAGTTGGPTTVEASASFSFVYPYYVGAGPAGKTPAQVGALTKRVIASTTSRTEVITASNGDVFYFAYPASYGALTSILDVNNFETIGDWTATTNTITGLDGVPTSYRIYEFKNPVVPGSYQYTFKR